MLTKYIIIISLAYSFCSGKVNQNDSSRKFLSNFTFGDPMPDYIDWREKNAVSPVRDQRLCKACWVFSTVSTIESHLRIYQGIKDDLSYQYLLDCDPDKNGCDKYASVLKTYANIVSILGGVPKSKDYYEYDGKYYTCRCEQNNLEKNDKILQIKSHEKTNIYDFHNWIENILKEDKINGFRPCPITVKVTGYKRVKQDEMIMLRYLVNNGPLTAGINSKSMEDWMVKPGDVYIDDPTPEKCPPDELNHSIEIVGHTTYQSDKDVVHYWIIKNSWGADWGDNGYYYLVAGKNACGISSDVSFPYV